MELSNEFLINIALPLLVAILAAAAAVYSEFNIRKRILRDIEIYEKWKVRLPNSISLPIKENLEKQIIRNINSMTGEAVGSVLLFDALFHLSITFTTWFLFSYLIKMGVFSHMDFSFAAPLIVVCVLLIIGLIYTSAKRILRFISCHSLLQKQMRNWGSQASVAKKICKKIEDLVEGNTKYFNDLKIGNSLFIKALDAIEDDVTLFDALELENCIALLKEGYALQEDKVKNVKSLIEDCEHLIAETKRSLEEINEAKYNVIFSFRLKRYERKIRSANNSLSSSYDYLMDSVNNNNITALSEKICQVETEIERRKDC